jgi:hypothetical protein
VITPDVDTLLDAVVTAVERDIAPAVADEYAARLCRTVARLLRAARVRVAREQATLAQDNAELRSLLAGARDRLPDEVRAAVDRAVGVEPAPRYPALEELQADAIRLRQALVTVIGVVPDDGDPVRRAARQYIAHQLDREGAWQQDAFTGPRR